MLSITNDQMTISHTYMTSEILNINTYTFMLRLQADIEQSSAHD